jgi:hypothetical protein
MCSSSAPAPATPDYTGAAVAQGAANLDAARTSAKLSNPNIIGPYGTQTVTYGTGDQQDIPTVTQTLNPNSQAALDSQQEVQKDLANLGVQATGTAQQILGTPFSASGTAANQIQDLATSPQAQTSIDSSNIAALPVNAGTTGQQALLSRLQPQITQRDQGLDNQLRQQGLVPGDEAYDNSWRDEQNANNDLYTQAGLQGLNLDFQANSQGFNQAQSNAALNNAGTAQNYNQALGTTQFNNSAQQAALQQQLALRGQPLNEIAALESGSQIQLPQFQQYQGQTVAPAPVFSAAQAQGNNALQQYGIQQAGLNANTSGLYGLGGSALQAGGLYAGLTG